MLFIESAGLTDVGQKRKGNEDSFLIDDSLGLYIVSDGMGGHLAGEVASSIAVETIKNYITRFKNNTNVDELDNYDEKLSKEANRLIAGILVANKGIYKVSLEKSSCKGMGATVSAIYFTGDTLIAANVGDSPIYMIHNDSIELLSVPHTVIAEHKILNPNADSSLENQFKHILTRAVGVDETVKPDSCEVQCFKGDSLVICSDGLSDKVSQDEILKIVSKEKPKSACRLLVNMANQRGGDDNITVIVLRVKKYNFFNSFIKKILSKH